MVNIGKNVESLTDVRDSMQFVIRFANKTKYKKTHTKKNLEPKLDLKQNQKKIAE